MNFGVKVVMRKNLNLNHKPMKKNNIKKSEKLYQEFSITSICRADLEQEGFDTKNLDDETMKELASRMADVYCEQDFWIDLEILANDLGIKKEPS